MCKTLNKYYCIPSFAELYIVLTLLLCFLLWTLAINLGKSIQEQARHNLIIILS